MPLNKKYYIGIDGGGTKTEALLGDNKGNLLAFAVGGSTNLKSRSPENIRKCIHDIISTLLLESKLETTQIQGVFVSTAGGDREEDRSRWIQWIDEKLKNIRIQVENDAVGALASGTFGKQGMVVIAGTGSIAYSFREERRKPIRVGGWGYLFGDEGSGYAIGEEALRLVAQAHDGRVKNITKLTGAILEQFSLNDPYQLITHIYENDYPRLKIASLAGKVIEVAEEGDKYAEKIIEQAINELSELVTTLYQKDEKSREFPLVLAGGLFKSVFFRNLFVKKLEKITHTIIVPEFSPVVGSYICSLAEAGVQIDDTVKKNIKISEGETVNGGKVYE